MNVIKTLLLGVIVISISCKGVKEENPKTAIQKAENQLSFLLQDAEKANRIPRTIDKMGNLHWTHLNFDWTEGFFPGSCWYLYEETKDEKWRMAAEKFQDMYQEHKYKTTNHDLGFIFNCSYGNGFRLTKNKAFKEVMITAADSLLMRFNPIVGCIKSWDTDKGWQSQRGWNFPVIIDNMMNLELLFKVSEFTNDPKYKEVAVIHANTTIKNHFRDDNSSVHVVDYDSETGVVRGKYTAQGAADNSSWARGQAWGLYGFTITYRHTKNKVFLEQAEKIARYIINFKDTPKDGVPYWDYQAPNIPNEPRDVSAAAITVSALLELNNFSEQDYGPTIDKIMRSLASDQYTAQLGENKHFILKHSVGSIPHGNEIDVPLNYADYYYLEALARYKNK